MFRSVTNSSPRSTGVFKRSGPRSSAATTAVAGALVFLASAAIAFGFTFLKYRYDPGTVLRDDGINEFVPYLIERGRLVAQGDWSVLTTNSLSGGNLLVDFGRSIFHPLIVALTLIATVIREPLRLAMLFGSLEMLSLMTGGYLLGRTVSLARMNAMLLGITLAFLPLNVALFTADHWNTGLGLSSFVWALTFAIRAFQQPNALRLLALAASCWVVFSTGWPFAYVVLALTLIVLAAAWCRPFAKGTGLPRRLLSTARIAAAVVLAFVAALPVFSEYAYLMPQLARSSTGINNADNFGVPSLGQMLSIGNPVGGDWWNTFWGYVYWGIPIGFVTMLVWALFFKRFDRSKLADPQFAPVFAAAAAMAVLMLVATQLPTYMGPLRWTFRYVGYFAVFAALLVFMLVERLDWRFSAARAKAAVITLVVGLVILSSRIPQPAHDKLHALLLPLAALAVLAMALWLLRSRRATAAVLCLALGGAALSSFTAVTSKESFVQTLNMPAASTLSAYDDELSRGYVLTVESDLPRGGASNLFENFNYGTRYLLFGHRVVNGYDPVVQKAYQLNLQPTTSQGNLPNASIAHLSQPIEGTDNKQCRFDQYGIRSVLLQSSGGDATANALVSCGFERVDGNDDEALYARSGLPALEGTATVADDGLVFGADSVISQQHEQVHVDNNGDTAATLHFARMYWPGYTATLDGQPLTVSASEDGVLVDVEIPAGASGTVDLHYEPVTWRLAVPAALVAAGLLLTFTVIGLAAEHRRSSLRHDGQTQ